MELELPLSAPARRADAISGLASTPAGAVPRPGRSVGWRAWAVPSFADLIFLICVLAMVINGGATISGDADMVRHLTVGQALLATGSVPGEGALVYTKPGHASPPYEWLAKASIAASYERMGLAGPVLLSAAMIGLAFAVLYQHLRRSGHPALLALGVTLLAAGASSVHWLARPHAFSFAAVAVFGAVLDGWWAGRLRTRWLWTLPPLMALWVNAHGGFLIGLILLGTYAGADTLRWLFGDTSGAAAARARLGALLPLAVASFVATYLNPAGPAMFLDIRDYLGSSLVLDFTEEYRSPDFHTGGVRFFLAMLLISLGALAWSRRRPALHEGLLLLGFTYFALYSARNIVLFAIVTAPLLAAQLAALARGVSPDARIGTAVTRVSAWLARRERIYASMDGRARGHLWPVLLLGALVWLAAVQWRGGEAPLGVRFDPARQPVAAVAYLKENLPLGNGFNEQRWGGYLLHQLWPAQRVFIDGELTARHQALMRDYLAVSGLAQGWEGVLGRHDVRWVLYSTDSPLVRSLAANPGWSVVYQDSIATVLTRTPQTP